MTSRRGPFQEPHRRAKPAAAGFLLLAVLLLTGPAMAVESYQPMRFDHLNAEDGLSQNSVKAIVQDSAGFMWFATENGLNRYDGKSFLVLRRERSPGAEFSNDFLTSLAATQDGRVWVGTDGGGLVQWDSGAEQFKAFRHSDDSDVTLSGDNVSAVLKSQDGYLWVGTLRSGLNRLTVATGEVVRFQHDPSEPASLPAGSIKALLEDTAGRLWVGTDQGLALMTRPDGVFHRFTHGAEDPGSLSDNRVRSLAQDQQGNLWVGTRKGLNRLNMTSRVFERFLHDPQDPATLSHDRIRALHADSHGRLWVGTSGGLNLLASDGATFIRYLAAPGDTESLADNNVLSIYEDRSGVLWVGTGAGGVSRWNPRSWSFGHFNANSGPGDSGGSWNVTSFAQDDNGVLWFGTFGGGLNALNRSSGSVQHFRHTPGQADSISGDRIMALAYQDGAIWAGTMTGGLNRLDPETGGVTAYLHDPANHTSLGADGIMSLFTDAGGNLWVGTFGGGANRFDSQTGQFVRYNHDPKDVGSLSASRATSFAQGPDGQIWVGTDGGGLNLLDPVTGRARHFLHDESDRNSLSSNTIYALSVDSRGTLWVGTRAGLDRFDPATLSNDRAVFRHFSQESGLANDVIYGIREDASGALWLSTNFGLSKFDPATGEITNYHRGHGLQAEEFNFGAHYKSADGELFFGGVNGFNAFFPEKLQANPLPPPLVVTRITKLNEPLAAESAHHRVDSLVLDHTDTVVGFEFAALDFTAPKQNRYAYKLEGFDEAWVDLGNRSQITYTNLDAGSYTLRIKAANSDGVWNETGLSLPVVMRAAPWATGWAYLAYMLMALGVVNYFWRNQRRKREMEREYTQRLEVEVKLRTQELADRNEDLERVNEKLAEASLTDPLTGLRNRRFLFEEVSKDVELMRRDYDGDAELIKQAERGSKSGQRSKGEDMAFMMLDLDHFKPINDRCGHVAGDKILMQVTDALKKVCRHSDFIIRWGGDEFLVVGRHANREEVDALAERIRAQIARTVFSLGDGQVARTTCSIGYACYPFVRTNPDALSWQQILGLADAAMYESKNSRNAWTGYLSTETSDTLDNIFKAVRDEPHQLLDQGLLEIRRGANKSSSASCA